MKLYGTTSFFVLTKKKSVFWKDLFSLGLLKIGDLLSCKNTTTSSFTNLLLNPEQSFFVISIIDSIPAHWRTIIKDSSSLPIISPVLDAPSIIIDENSLTFSDVSSKQIYRQFQAKKQADCLPLKRNCLKSIPTLRHRLGEGVFSILRLWNQNYEIFSTNF